MFSQSSVVAIFGIFDKLGHLSSGLVQNLPIVLFFSARSYILKYYLTKPSGFFLSFVTIMLIFM